MNRRFRKWESFQLGQRLARNFLLRFILPAGKISVKHQLYHLRDAEEFTNYATARESLFQPPPGSRDQTRGCVANRRATFPGKKLRAHVAERRCGAPEYHQAGSLSLLP